MRTVGNILPEKTKKYVPVYHKKVGRGEILRRKQNMDKKSSSPIIAVNEFR